MMKVNAALAVNRDAITWKQVPYSCMSFYQDLRKEAEDEILRVNGIVFIINYGEQVGPALFNQRLIFIHWKNYRNINKNNNKVFFLVTWLHDCVWGFSIAFRPNAMLIWMYYQKRWGRWADPGYLVTSTLTRHFRTLGYGNSNCMV